MLSQGLYRLGRVSARRPWVVIGAWIVLALVVVGSSSAFGRDYEDSFRVPGLDSQKANDLIAAAGTGEAGMSAQVVVTPVDGTCDVHRRRRRARAPRRDPGADGGAAERAVDDRPGGRARRRRRGPAEQRRGEPGRPCGAGAPAVRHHRPAVAGRLRGAEGAARRARRRSCVARPRRGGRRPVLRVRDLAGQRRRAHRPARRGRDPVRRLRVAHRDGHPAGHRGGRPRRRHEPHDPAGPVHGRAQLGAGAGRDGRARSRHRLRAVHHLAAPALPRRGRDGARVGGTRPRHRRSAGGVRGRHRRGVGARPRRRGRAVHDRRRHRARAHGGRHGGGVRHAAAGAARAVRSCHHALRVPAQRPRGQRPLVALDHPRHALLVGLRDRRGRAARRPRRADALAAPGDPRRRHAADEPDGAPGLRPGGAGVRSGTQRTLRGRDRHGVGHHGGAAPRRRAAPRPGGRVGGGAVARVAHRRRRRSSPSRPPVRRTRRRATPWSGCAPRSSRPRCRGALHRRTSGVRW